MLLNDLDDYSQRREDPAISSTKTVRVSLEFENLGFVCREPKSGTQKTGIVYTMEYETGSVTRELPFQTKGNEEFA